LFAQQIGLPFQGRSRLVNRLLLVFITHLGANNQDVPERSATCAETPAPKYDIPSAGAYKELLLLCEAMDRYLAPGLTYTNVDAGTFPAPTKDIILSAPLHTIQPFGRSFHRIVGPSIPASFALTAPLAMSYNLDGDGPAPGFALSLGTRVCRANKYNGRDSFLQSQRQ
jgi:hypothetical protein